jgi:hypothetical protein
LLYIRTEKNVNVRTYKTIILPVVLYGCETWSLTLREEHTLRKFENRVLRRIFGPKMDGVTGGWKTLQNEELHDLYSSPSIIKIIKMKSRRMRWAGHVARIGEKRSVHRLLVRKPDRKSPLRSRRRWIDLRWTFLEIGLGDMEWIGLAQDRYRWRALVNSVMNLRVPHSAGKLPSSTELHRISYVKTDVTLQEEMCKI